MTGQGQNFLFDKLVLSDDATLGGDRSWGSVRSQSTLDMGGHDLTIAASAYWRFTDVEHPGDIVLRSWLDVRDNGTFPASEDVHEIRVMATGVLSFYGWPKPCPWRIRFAEPTNGTFNVHPGGGTSESLNVLSGPVVIDEGVTVRFNCQNDARWQMTFAGPVSGAVTLPTLSTTARLHLRCQTAQSPDGWTLAHVRQYLSSVIGSLCVLDIPADAAASASSVRTAARAA